MPPATARGAYPATLEIWADDEFEKRPHRLGEFGQLVDREAFEDRAQMIQERILLIAFLGVRSRARWYLGEACTLRDRRS